MSDLITRLREKLKRHMGHCETVRRECDCADAALFRESLDALEARALHALIAEWEDDDPMTSPFTVAKRAIRRECAAQLKARLEPAK